MPGVLIRVKGQETSVKDYVTNINENCEAIYPNPCRLPLAA